MLVEAFVGFGQEGLPCTLIAMQRSRTRTLMDLELSVSRTNSLPLKLHSRIEMESPVAPSTSVCSKYPAPGDPDLAAQIARTLECAGFKPVLDTKRGWDHGTFVPLIVMRPQADLPVIQMSILRGGSDEADAERNLRYCAAMKQFRCWLCHAVQWFILPRSEQGFGSTSGKEEECESRQTNTRVRS